jgi:GNAT superfamily N-acetyltransferase
VTAPVRRATGADAATIARLLYDFNREFDAPTPKPAALAERVGEVMDNGDETIVLLADEETGLAVLRLRPGLWSRALECHLAELYVIPARRREGIGLALMEAALATARGAGCDRMDLGTGDTDTGARALYERLGFTNRESDGAVSLFYEREL